LQIEEGWVLIEEPAMSCVRRKTGPLLVTDEGGERDSFTGPALAVTHSVLLSFLFLITVTANRAGISGRI
jgi:hypothetical protein